MDAHALAVGRPTAAPIVLVQPKLVPMTEAEREPAVQSLAVLLESWLDERTRPSHEKPGDNRRSLPTWSLLAD
jgi:hypothetical protein